MLPDKSTNKTTCVWTFPIEIKKNRASEQNTKPLSFHVCALFLLQWFVQFRGDKRFCSGEENWTLVHNLKISTFWITFLKNMQNTFEKC
jgi:hypothetical protein